MKVKRLLSVVLSLAMLAGTATALAAEIATDGTATDGTVIFTQNFDGETALDTDQSDDVYWGVNSGTVADDMLQIKSGGWPQLNFKNKVSESKKYEFSYKMKFDTAGGLILNVFPGSDIGIGSAVPGTSIGHFKNYTDTSSTDCANEANINTWYTIKTEFCTNSVYRYIKHTIIDESGNTVYSDIDNKMYKAGTAYGMFETPTIDKVYFWNKNNPGTLYVDDIVLKEIGSIPTDSNVILQDSFSDGKCDLGLWDMQGASVDENGSLVIPNGKFPYLYIPTVSDTDSAYRFSYTIKGDTNGNKVKVYADKSSNRGFGGFVSSQGFVFTKLNVNSAPEYAIANYNNEEYTVEVEFCEKTGGQFTKWTLKSSTGDVLYSTKKTSLWNSESGAAATDSIFGKRICFWNSGSNTSNVYIDDVKLEKIEASIDFEENFDVADIDALCADGNGWRGNSKGSIENGQLKLPHNAWIYFDVVGKADAPYKVTYDIMTTGETTTAGGTALIANDTYLLGAYNPLIGLDTYKRTFDDATTIPVSEANGKWYTVTAEINETEANGYMRYTLTDKETQTVVGTYTLPMLKNEKDEAITLNASAFYFWNRGGADSVTYIDNLKFEKINTKMYIASITATDKSGNVVELNDDTTPSLAKINVQLTSIPLAADGITLTEKDGSSVETAAAPATNNIEITVTGALKSNTTYTLTIPNSITDENDIALENPITIDFTTNAKTTTGRITSIGDLTDFNDLPAGGTVDVKATVNNSGDADKSAALIATFYKGDIFSGVQIKNDITVTAGTTEDITFTVNVPTDMTDVTSIKVFLWDSLSGLVPYSNYSALTK